MFTGLITDVGAVVDIKDNGVRRITVSTGYDPETIGIGDSIACSGPCLTVVGKGSDGDRGWFAVDAAAETLALTTVGQCQHMEAVDIRTVPFQAGRDALFTDEYGLANSPDGGGMP